jgi:hypothetical protein
MCGSNQLYTSAQQNGCFLELLIGGVVSKSFDTKTTIVTTSTAGNIKLISHYPSSIVLLSDDDVQAMGYADKAAFLAFYDSIEASCSGNTPPPPPTVLNVSVVGTMDNGQVLTVNAAAPSLTLGGNHNVVANTDLSVLEADGIFVTWSVITNGFLTVRIENQSGNDAVTVPPISFNIYSL